MPVESEVANQSVLAWIFSSLGPFYLILLPLTALTAFALCLLIVMRGRGPWAGVALLLVLLAPLLLGVFAALQGMLSSYQIIAIAGATPEPADLALGISTALVAPVVAMLLMIPAFIAAALGALVRCLRAPAE